MLPDINILVLDPPSGLTATPISTSSIQLTWGAVPNATSYNIYRSLTENGTYTLLTNVTTTTYTDTGLIQNTTYYYRVEGINATETGTPSAPVGATTEAIGAPDTVTINETIPTSITLNWTPVIGATTYLVFRSMSINGPFSIIATTTNTNYIDNNLASNTTYYYRITPYINTTPGTTSNTASATTQQQNNNNNCCCRCNSCCNTCSCCNFCNNFNQCCCNRCCRRNWLFWW